MDELLPAYALHALGQHERALVEEHIVQCATCRRALSEYQDVAEELLYAAPQTPAPAHLRADLVRRVRNSGKASVRPAAPQAVSRQAGGARRWVYALVAAFLLLLSVANLVWWRMASDLRASQAALQEQVEAQRVAMQLLASGGQTAVLRGDQPAPQVVALLTWAPDQTAAVLQVSDLPPAPAGQAYQLWLVRDGQRDSGGLFAPDPQGRGVLVVQAPQPLQSYQAVGVTLEPAGGSPGPTGPRVFGGSL